MDELNVRHIVANISYYQLCELSSPILSQFNFTEDPFCIIISANIQLKAAIFSAVYQYNVFLADGFNFYCGGGVNIGALYLNHRSTAALAVGFAPTGEEQSGYVAEVTFSNGLNSTYKTKLSLIQQMDGTGGIITKDQRLIERFIQPIRAIFDRAQGN